MIFIFTFILGLATTKLIQVVEVYR